MVLKSSELEPYGTPLPPVGMNLASKWQALYTEGSFVCRIDFSHAWTPGSLGDGLLQILIFVEMFLEHSTAASYKKVLQRSYPNKGIP